MHRVLCENSRMFKIRVILFLLIIVCGRARALDEFEGVKCEADIPKSLVGKRYKNERVVVLEERRKDLGLKGLGGIEISDRLFLISWQICGSEYELLLNTKSRLIRDVLPFPAHSAASPQFIGNSETVNQSPGPSGNEPTRRCENRSETTSPRTPLLGSWPPTTADCVS